MKKLRMLYKILRITGLWVMIQGFFVFLILSSIAIYLFEPQINSYADAMWYLFASFTTIGYGDFVAVTVLGRIVTVITSLYGILVVAFIPAVIISYYNAFEQTKADESTSQFLDKLENLPSLSRKELEQISEKIKKDRYKL